MMEAGRELDALVAEKVFDDLWPIDELEFRELPHAWHCVDYSGWSAEKLNDMLPKYSASIAAAWEVVEKMQAGGWGHKHLIHSPDAEHPGVSWTFMKPGQGDQSITDIEIIGEVPHAICLAALKAVAG